MPASSKTSTSARTTARKPASRKRTAKASPAKATPTAVEWTGSLDLTRAKALSDELKNALAASDTVTVSAHDVEGTDLAIVQILLAASHTAARDGKILRLEDPASELEPLCQELGFGTVYERLVRPDEEVKT